jgi:hypothetical protein
MVLMFCGLHGSRFAMQIAYARHKEMDIHVSTPGTVKVAKSPITALVRYDVRACKRGVSKVAAQREQQGYASRQSSHRN